MSVQRRVDALPGQLPFVDEGIDVDLGQLDKREQHAPRPGLFYFDA
jgi:hypothetical protein